MGREQKKENSETKLSVRELTKLRKRILFLTKRAEEMSSLGRTAVPEKSAEKVRERRKEYE